MISPSKLAEYFNNNVLIIKMQAEDLSHAESLVQLPFRANCFNWVIGHLVTNRLQILKLLDSPPPFDPGLVARYARESEPITGEGPGVLPLAELIGLLEQLQTQMAAALEKISVEALEQERAFFGSRVRPVAEWLLFFYFHDTYHVGQTEILRQAAGKDDKII